MQKETVQDLNFKFKEKMRVQMMNLPVIIEGMIFFPLEN